MANMTRRQFFRGDFRDAKRVVASAPGKEQSDTESAPRFPDDLGAIAGDFPPEMLSLEAKRLGMDPETADRTTLLTAIYAAMAGGGPRESGV